MPPAILIVTENPPLVYAVSAMTRTSWGPIPDMDNTHSFEEELRSSLAHLYDPSRLRKSPLVRLFGLQADPNPAQALRGALETAIVAMQPGPASPPSERSRRHYQVLYYRYVQQFTQNDVANQLSLSPRHLRRAQTAAIQELAGILRSRYGLPDDVDQLIDGDTDGVSGDGQGIEREMNWLGDSMGDQVTEVEPALQQAVHLARTLADKHNVTINSSRQGSIPPVSVAETVLKQIVLGLITTAVGIVPDGCVLVSLCGIQDKVVIDLMASPASDRTCCPPEDAGLEMARRLVELFNGDLSIVPGQESFRVRAELPSTRQIIVLAIEDNRDTLQLWERYLQNTSFRLVGVTVPEDALSMAIDEKPDLILLDLMLPSIDGWELLGQLRHHPQTSHVPDIICTVLPQEELALSLGASAFIRKPITRRAFRSVLRQQIEALEPE